MNTALDLQLKPSVRAHQWLFWLHALPLILLPFAMESGATMLALAAAIGLSWVGLRRHPAFGYGPRALTRIVAQVEGGWLLGTAGGAQIEAQLLDDTYRQSFVIVLNFRDASQRRRTRVLLGDELSAEALRRLRLRLSERAAASDRSEPSSP